MNERFEACGWQFIKALNEWFAETPQTKHADMTQPELDPRSVAVFIRPWLMVVEPVTGMLSDKNGNTVLRKPSILPLAVQIVYNIKIVEGENERR
ncbi:MAG: hypothetical protein ACP5VQ_04495 [Phycisphaerae bacterium]